MKRILKTFSVLLVGLLLLATSVDAALDYLSHSTTQSSFTIYSEQGTTLLTYNGDLNACKTFGKPGMVVVPRFLHRT